MSTRPECVPGLWGGLQSACGVYYCGTLGAQVPECTQSDCKEEQFLWLEADGGELSGTLAFSATAKTLSAPNEQANRWGFSPDAGQLYLASSPNQLQPYACGATELDIGSSVAGSRWAPLPSGQAAAMEQGRRTQQWTGIPVP